MREPFIGPSIECGPPNQFSPTDDHENLKPAGPRAGRRCGHDEVRVRVKVVSEHQGRSKKAKVLMIADDSAGNLNGPAKSKERIRVVSNVEHVVRECQRRDDMAGKFNILESMLPSSSSSVSASSRVSSKSLLILTSSGSMVLFFHKEEKKHAWKEDIERNPFIRFVFELEKASLSQIASFGTNQK